MGLLSFPLRLPLLPVTALVRLAEVIQEQAEVEMQSAIRRQLEDAEYARASGRATDEEIARLEEEAVQRLIEFRRQSGSRVVADPHNDGS
jgi:outer membrane protein TolC